MSNKYPGGIITSGANAGYSVFFDGTGDFLSLSNQTALQMATGDFTIEFWFYPTNVNSTNQRLLTTTSGAIGSTDLLIRLEATNTIRCIVGSTSMDPTTPTITANTWNHVALVRSGSATNNCSIYLNGSRISQGTSTSNISVGIQYIGGYYSTGPVEYFYGYMSNVRVVKGTALYSGTTITPPTQLLAITNTSLLTCNSPAIVDQSSNAFTITANGNAAVSTFTPFVGTQLVPNPNTLANTQGVWSISQAAYWMSQNKWPMPPNYPLQSLRFNSADSTYLNRTPASTSNRRTWTWSGWVKRSGISTEQSLFGCYVGGDTYTVIRYLTGATLQITQDDGAGTQWNLVTTAVYRDVSSWYHVVVAVDTTQATTANRVKLYINGTQVTAFSTESYPSQNFDTQINRNQSHLIGQIASTYYFNGYMADVNFVDGQALTPSSFGANDPNTGVWSPVPYSGTYGTNGFRLSFQNNTGTTATTLGKDYSGNGNNWTPNNFSVAAGSGNDSLTDGPTNWGIDYGNGGEVRGNYATLNPLATVSSLSSITVANGNLQLDYTRAGGQSAFGKATIALPSSGKFYYEMNIISASSTPSNLPAFDAGLVSATAFSVSSTGGLLRTIYLYDGTKFDGTTYSTYGAAFAAGDVVNIAVDMDNGRIYFGKNGNWGNGAGAFNQTFGSATAAFTDLISSGYTWNPGTWISGGTAGSYYFNFGQRPFAYTAPSGFKALCTTNLPIPAVGATSATLASKQMDVVLYTGNSTNNRVVSGYNFAPDLVWVKSRSNTTNHGLFDILRSSGTAWLGSNLTDGETTTPNFGGLNSLTSDGFTTKNGGTDNTITNQTGYTYAAWAWKANGTGVSNTAGSITSTVSANQTAGISIVTYTGTGSNATVGHGIGVAPSMIIVKRRGAADTWRVYHSALGNTKFLNLNETAAAGTASTVWNNTSPTSTVFSISTDSAVNSSSAGNTFVAYCFAEIAGFSKFGSYTGNGSTDGPFVYCGFRPRFLMVKRTDTTSNWVVIDTARDTYNAAGLLLRPNVSDAESDDRPEVDILSNGLKWRDTTAALNASGGTYIFMAFAESPFNYSRAR